MFLGYSPNHKGYKLHIPTNKIEISRHSWNFKKDFMKVDDNFCLCSFLHTSNWHNICSITYSKNLVTDSPSPTNNKSDPVVRHFFYPILVVLFFFIKVFKIINSGLDGLQRDYSKGAILLETNRRRKNSILWSRRRSVTSPRVGFLEPSALICCCYGPPASWRS